MAEKIVTLYKNGNMLVVEPTTDAIFSLLRQALTFHETIKFRGKEAYQRKALGLSQFERKEHALFELDARQRLATNFGFWGTISQRLKKAGYTVRCHDLRPENKEIFTPVWRNISRYSLRENQPDFVREVLRNRCGRFDCPPGFGKTFMLGVISALFPKAKIDIVTRRVSVLRDRIFPELVQMVGDVGIIGGGKKIENRRVMCYTVGSMHYSPATADILIGDEVHELAADQAAGQLVRWQRSRNYGLSASHDMRFDGKDLRMHGVFGPVVFRVDYRKAQDAQMVVPIRIVWTPVVMDYNPCAAREDTEKKRYGIWENDYRNRLIAADARKYDDATQVLITVDTLEHAMQLKRVLPEFTVVCQENSLSPERIKSFAQRGCCSRNEPVMTLDRRLLLTRQFEKGILKKAICTTVWNVGVSFNSLTVLIRAAGGGSSINDIQIPGRVSRVADGKTEGIVHDYTDEFDPSLHRQAESRSDNYSKSGWINNFPAATKKNYSGR